MGMNYYAKINLKEAIQDCSYISPIALECIKKFNLHIGKSSMGWKFCFQEQTIYNYKDSSIDNDLVLNSFEKWKDFLSRADIEIWNEDGESVNKEWFFKFVEEKQKEEHPNKYDFKDSIIYNHINGFYFSEDGYRFDKGDFS